VLAAAIVALIALIGLHETKPADFIAAGAIRAPTARGLMPVGAVGLRFTLAAIGMGPRTVGLRLALAAVGVMALAVSLGLALATAGMMPFAGARRIRASLVAATLGTAMLAAARPLACA
jgi:hypothetical protein